MTSAAGLALAEAHRLAQAHNTDAATLAVMRAFEGLLDPNNLDGTFRTYAKVAAQLINGHRAKSSSLAAAFYQALRKMETQAAPLAKVGLAADVDPVQLETSLLVTGPVKAKGQMAKGMSSTDAFLMALQMTLGAVSRHVQNGARDTIRKAVQHDDLATAWARRSGGNPCSFCAMLISRGPAYKTAGTAHFKTHDKCRCEALPVFEGDHGWTAQANEFRAIWDSATAGKSGAEARAAFRQEHSQRWPMRSAGQVRTDALGEHVVRTAQDIAAKAAQEAAKAAAEAAAKEAAVIKAAEEAAAKEAQKAAALDKKWKGKPAPKPPVAPDPPKTAKQKALDEWLAGVNARYDALGTGKKLADSFNYSYVERVLLHGDKNALDYLKENHYVDEALHKKALDALKRGDAFDPADESVYKSALRSFKNRTTRHERYLAEWREVNGISVQLNGMDGARTFATNGEAADFAKKTFHEFADGPEKDALFRYTTSSYTPWNSALRSNASGSILPKGTWQEPTRLADAGFQRSPFPEDTIVHRGTDFDEFEFPGGIRTANIPPPDPRDLVGTVQAQHGYMSTSIGTDAAFSYSRVQMTVRVPKGHHGAYVDFFSAHKGEREVILQRSTHYFIHDVYKDARGNWRVEVEVLPPGVDPHTLAGHPTMPGTKR